ncbi:MAG: LysR family transcriptional regulator [Phycisphaera sp.]|nr:LysR family transcriptional regulator [Phycisphaera sp.]
MNGSRVQRPLDCSLRELHAVSCVAAEANFGRAARRLGIAQATLSGQVRKVEEALGARLFERRGRRFLVTDEGRALLPQIDGLLAAAGALADESRRLASAELRPLRVGVIPTLGPYLVPHLLAHAGGAASAAARRKGPAELPFEVSEHRTAELLELLAVGAIDAAVLAPSGREPGLVLEPLFTEPFRLLARRGSAILGVKRLVPNCLDAHEMVLLEEGHCMRDHALAICHAGSGDEPKLAAASIETLKYLVAAGAGYSLLPALACSIPTELGTVLELRAFDGQAPSRHVALAARTGYPRLGEVGRLAAWIREAVRARAPIVAE